MLAMMESAHEWNALNSSNRGISSGRKLSEGSVSAKLATRPTPDPAQCDYCIAPFTRGS